MGTAIGRQGKKMKHTFAELSCIALLWTGAAGVVASMFIPNTHLGQVQSLCEFSAVIAAKTPQWAKVIRDAGIKAE